jgi:hypothetical protein
VLTSALFIQEISNERGSSMTRPKDFFTENHQLFSNPSTEQERFNLYGGLVALCNQIDDMERRIRSV